MSFRNSIRSAFGLFRTVNSSDHEGNTSTRLPTRIRDAFLSTFHFGFTCFGGPPVHFQIFHRRFVDGVSGRPWIDEQTYQELFAVSQALPGPASTKMLFNITQTHSGLIPAVMVFLLWSMPGSIAMYGLSLGVSHIGDRLPGPVYALLSGLNSATVGIIALAAVQLARKAITDKLTRLLVVFGACAGMCYNALWYFPVLLLFAGALTAGWDFYAQRWVVRLTRSRKRRRSSSPPNTESDAIQMEDLKTEEERVGESQGPVRRPGTSHSSPPGPIPENTADNEGGTTNQPPPSTIEATTYRVPVKIGVALIILFFVTFASFMAVRGTVLSRHASVSQISTSPSSFLLDLFTNMFLAGTIIFGGGPVVIPLLRNYVVDPGWVSPRDFLLGLAVIQALPGPNFNFAVYLGALAAANKTNLPSIVGAILAFLGIFTPGLWLSIGFQSIWQSLRRQRAVSSVLRGVNAAAVGFVFTAVYRLWEIGYLTAKENKGISLGKEPWWLVVAASTFTAVEWFSMPPPLAILSGGVAGIAWWGAVGKR